MPPPAATTPPAEPPLSLEVPEMGVLLPDGTGRMGLKPELRSMKSRGAVGRQGEGC